MTGEEKLDRLDGIFALDSGCVSSGIKDDSFKVYLLENKEELKILLTALAKQYLNGDGYDIEDVAELLQWAKDEFDVVYT